MKHRKVTVSSITLFTRLAPARKRANRAGSYQVNNRSYCNFFFWIS